MIKSLLPILVTSFFGLLIQGCATPLQPATTTGLEMYAESARQHTSMLEVALPPADVYLGLLRIVKRHPELTIVDQDDERYLVEVEDAGKRWTGQATDLGEGTTLLHLWTDAGVSGKTGAELTRSAIEEICSELAVSCKYKKSK